ncbi:acyltransferase [Hymenobacter sp. BT186]|uniref:Acyltransferase n=1 Tax=Hymenobacter telluris TaxID=2816474 RepID=A0A939ETR0_9BACT|nr:acyltransferase [Hymenobacter telluris]MBO0356989.1 acyltransferase [Hymenobacter telluris]MBW3373016.1 acyltransferase [Hymenobacter norwichensis]
MPASATPALPPHTLHYLDGIRGLAAVVVVAHHLASVFYPALITADPQAIRLGGWELVIAGSPLNVVLGGHLAVCLFFVLSGVVLSEQYFRTGQLAAVQSQAARRYVRLVVPVGFSVLLAAGLHWAGAFRHVELSRQLGNTWLAGFWQEPLGAGWELVLDALIRVPLNGEAKYNPVHWTLNTELIGSYFVFALLALFGNFRRRGLLYVFMLVVLQFANLSFYLAAFTVGVALNDARHHAAWPVGLRRNRRVAAGLLLLVAALLGSFPQAGFVEVEATAYRFLQPSWFTHDRAMQVAHILGAAAFIAAVMASPTLRRALGAKWLRWLGGISFSLYLLHFLVIATFTSTVFLALPPQLSYHTGVLLSVLATVPVLLLLAWAMYRLVDLPGIRLARWLYQRLFQPAAA